MQSLSSRPSVLTFQPATVHFGEQQTQRTHIVPPKFKPADVLQLKPGTPYKKLSFKIVNVMHDPIIGDIYHAKFSNGMNFYGMPRKNVPLISMGELYKVGSVDEENWNNGVSHFLEHLIFKGTEKIKPGEFDKGLENMGASVNAYTANDHTFYFLQNMPKESLAEAIKLRAEVVQNPLIPQEELDKERHAVLEEISLYKNEGTYPIQRQMEKMLHAGSPYQRTILGPSKNIRNLSRDEILSYFAQHYGPNNRTILAVGDFEPEAMLHLIAENYNHPFPPQLAKGLNQSKHPRHGEALKPTPTTSEVLLERDDVKTVIGSQGFIGPNPHAPGARRELLALHLLADILGGSENSRLHQSLVEKERLATSVSMGTEEHKSRSCITLSFLTEPENRVAVLEKLRHHLDEVIAKGVEPVEMARTKLMAEHALANSPESASGLLYMLADAVGSERPLEEIGANQLKLLASIMPPEIQAVAKKYLQANQAKTALLLPKKLIPDHLPVPKFGGALGPLDKSIHIGSELVVHEKKGSPITSISLLIKGGSQNDQGVHGLTGYLTNLLERGTKDLPFEKLQQFLADHALSLNISSDFNNISLHMKGLARYSGEMIKIIKDLLQAPGFRLDDLNLLRKQHESFIRASEDTSPTYVLKQHLQEALYPIDHPYGNSEKRSLKNAEKMTPEEFRSVFQERLHPSRVTMAISGGMPFDQAKSLAEELLIPLSNDKATPTPLKNGAPLSLLKDRTITFTRKDLKQAELRRVWVGPSDKAPDRIPMLLLNSVLSGGMSGRLFQRFREKEEALCYTVNAGNSQKPDSGEFRFFVGTDPKNLKRVQEVLEEELEKLFKVPPTEEELKRAKLSWKASSLAAMESNSFMSSHISRHRALNYPSLPELVELIDKVTPEQVQAVAKKYLQDKPSLTVVMAPEDALKNAGLPAPEQPSENLPLKPLKAKL
jgi:zinc protease